MKRIFYLKTCDTCKRLLKKMDCSDFILQNIKAEAITANQLEYLYKITQSYEALFSKRAKKYKEMDLKNQNLTEKDYKQLILEEYTFLKRPVIVNGAEIWVGNTKKCYCRKV